jgi:two-component system, NarL family, sensor kinase
MSGIDVEPPGAELGTALLISIIDTICVGSDLDTLSDGVARLVVDATGTDACFVHVLDDAHRALVVVGSSRPPGTFAGPVVIRLGTGIPGWVASRRQPAAAPSERDDERFRELPHLVEGCWVGTLAVPMTSRTRELVGVLEVHTRARRNFSDRDVRILASMGRLVAGAMQQARVGRQLAARSRAREVFAEQVVELLEAERRRLAGEIHDAICQRLASLAYHLTAAEDALRAAPDFAAEQLRAVADLADQTLAEARAAIRGLRPPVLDDLGLADGLESLARSAPFEEVLVDVQSGRLPDHLETTLFRIAQEAVQNAAKHSGTRRLRIVLRCQVGAAVLTVTDEGRGFDVLAQSRLGRRDAYGLTGMTERAELVGGRCFVISAPGRGTTVTATVPLRPPVATDVVPNATTVIPAS